MNDRYVTVGPMFATSPSPSYYAPPRVPAYLPPSSPPSTYAVAGVLEGEQGSMFRLACVTVLRAIFIAPGLWVVVKITGNGIKLWRIILMSFGASTTISLGMLGWYALQKTLMEPYPAGR